jgi:sulfite reductase (NADPH) flavoprotein alpha-component
MSAQHTRKNPFHATLSSNRTLTGEGSGKETRHIEISLSGSGLRYEPGDALGVFPSNDPALVGEILAELGFAGDEPVSTRDGEPTTLRDALMRNCLITVPSKHLLMAVAERDRTGAFLRAFPTHAALEDLEQFLNGRDVLDILREFPGARFSADEFVRLLRKLQPRLYSIASSQNAVGESVHLTVAVVRFGVGHNARMRDGVCSTFLARRAGADIPVFIHCAKHFRMPEDPAAPVIMVGPGTGVAPFRAFLQERRAAGHTGPAWLIFGEQHAATDFLYRDEIEAALAEGVLTRLTTAFSRDQPHKIYVQHRMREEGADLFGWLEKGAYFYVCGDAARMARDVDAALRELVATHGGLAPERAEEYVEAMKKSKRYRKDVY